jgi:putative ABC transport system permease protein
MLTDLIENVQVAWDGLTANKMRSTLTMLGVIIGVGAVISLLSIGEGAQTAITDQVTSIGSNLLFVSPGAYKRGPVQEQGGSANTLTWADAEAIASPGNVPDAVIVAPEFTQNTQVVFGNANINTQVTGVTPKYLNLSRLRIARGRFIEEKDVNGRSNVAVLGYQAARDLFGGFDPLGQKIKVTIPGGSGGRVSLTVVGVMAEYGDSQLVKLDDMVLVPVTTAQTKIFDGRNGQGELIVTRVTVMVTSEARMGAAQSQLNALLLRRHNIGPGEEADFSVMSLTDMLSMLSQLTSIMTVFLSAIAAISLLVGGIGIMNIMLVSVTERTREIGTRKAVGARKADVLIQFLLEAMVLSLLGGAIGILLGVGIARLVDLAGVTNAVISARSVLLAVGFSLAVGLFFGIYPANRAASLNPIEALRYE